MQLADVTFADGVRFSWSIERDATDKNVGDRVGDANNTFENWGVFKVSSYDSLNLLMNRD